MSTDDEPLGPHDDAFSVHIARLEGASRSELRRRALAAPFHGVRIARDAPNAFHDIEDPYERQRLCRVECARIYAVRLHSGHFFSHTTAASIWGAPLPLEFADTGGIAEYAELPLHVSASGHVPFPRAVGVTGHRTLSSMTAVQEHRGLRVTSPSATWASLGALSVPNLVALGDYFCRVWRAGHGRRDVGRPPLADVEQLQRAMEAGRRRGAARLRAALDLIRTDAWSPRESLVRCILIDAGLPEPQLNVDVCVGGRFLACVDMAYPAQRVAIEYLGMLHDERWAADVERLAALRAAGWTVIEVTAPLLRSPETLVRRVAAALRR
ncbi:hypothetical protein [Microbacterium hydrocarbonoxydans]|uniref:hypothetical protein n=1 Tax=Microbacterium hydrocarbonoxydans TaxID=273678 RepID=UPI00203FF132|nr:hypothetical protein [Microbacterium hydrocarbonoxydans]MCM3780733.1 hypothetical protein [Microbacterium hydrocarbonoxydans]